MISDGILQESEYGDLSQLKADRDFKLPKERMRYLALRLGLNEVKEKTKCEVKLTDVPFTERELVDLLTSENLPVTGSKIILQNRCKSNNLPICRSVERGFIACWEGKPKGLITICVERGLIPLEKVLVGLWYSKNGKKGADGEIDKTTSLVSILSNCADFKNETSIIEKIVEHYGSQVWFTPKYHCEIAGEGVEYM